MKSNRVGLMWVLPFCVGLVLFAPDLVRFVLGEHKWHPAVLLIQGLAGAAAIQQLGYNWFSFYRARGDSTRQAVESAVMVVTFLGLAIPGLAIWGSGGFIVGRIASALLVLAVRRHYVVRLLPRARLLLLGARGAAPIAVAALAVLGLRAGVWHGHRTAAQAVVEIVVFVGLTAAVTWMAERRLIVERSTPQVRHRAARMNSAADSTASGRRGTRPVVRNSATTTPPPASDSTRKNTASRPKKVSGL